MIKMVTIHGPTTPGNVVPKPPGGNGLRTKGERLYNPDGQPFTVTVPFDSWIQCLLRDGSITLADPVAPAPAKRKVDDK